MCAGFERIQIHRAEGIGLQHRSKPESKIQNQAMHDTGRPARAGSYTHRINRPSFRHESDQQRRLCVPVAGAARVEQDQDRNDKAEECGKAGRSAGQETGKEETSW